jgi:hypothetical protein
MFSLTLNNAITALGPLMSEHSILLEDKIDNYFPELKIENCDII